MDGGKRIPFANQKAIRGFLIILSVFGNNYFQQIISKVVTSVINIELISLLRLALPSPPPSPSSLPLSFLLSYKYMSSRLRRHIIKYDRKISYPCIVVLEFLCVYM